MERQIISKWLTPSQCRWRWKKCKSTANVEKVGKTVQERQHLADNKHKRVSSIEIKNKKKSTEIQRLCYENVYFMNFIKKYNEIYWNEEIFLPERNEYKTNWCDSFVGCSSSIWRSLVSLFSRTNASVDYLSLQTLFSKNLKSKFLRNFYIPILKKLATYCIRPAK